MLALFWATFVGGFLGPLGMISWTIFWSLFGPLLGTILGSIFGPDRPKRGQDEPKRAIGSFKEPKSCIFKKVVFAGDCLHFFTLEASQESLKRPKKAPKRHPKRSKTPKKEIQNWTQKLTNFGPILGSKIVSKAPGTNDPKPQNPKDPQKSRSDPNFGAMFWLCFWPCFWPGAKMAPKTAQDSFRQPKIDPLLLNNRSKLAQTWTQGAPRSQP